LKIQGTATVRSGLCIDRVIMRLKNKLNVREANINGKKIR